jgi:hypothetical protein
MLSVETKAQDTAVTYNVSPNGPAGDWYWEVIAFNRQIIARGLAPTMTQARKNAFEAALHRQPAAYFAEDALLSFETE